MKSLNYYLVKDLCRDGNYEHRDHSVLATYMEEADVLKTNEGGEEYVWEKAYLNWQFTVGGKVSEDDYEGYWSDCRNVSIESVTKIPETDAKELFRILNHTDVQHNSELFFYHEELETIIEWHEKGILIEEDGTFRKAQ